MKPTSNKLSMSHIKIWLQQGLHTLKQAWGSSIMYGGMVTIIGLLLMWLLIQYKFAPMVYPLVGGFILIAPILLVGFFQIAERIRQNEPVKLYDFWAGFRHGSWGLWGFNALLMFLFLIWFTDAGVLYGIYLGKTSFPVSFYWLHDPQPALITFLWFSTIMGAVLALILYCVTVFAIPLMFYQKLRFTTAVMLSVKAVFNNFFIMIIWGIILAGCSFISLLLFPPLFIVIYPLLAYASDRAYHDVFDIA